MPLAMCNDDDSDGNGNDDSDGDGGGDGDDATARARRLLTALFAERARALVTRFCYYTHTRQKKKFTF